MQEIEIWPYKPIVYEQHKISYGECNAQTPLGFWDTNGLANLNQMTRSNDCQKKKMTACWTMNFAVPADHRVKLKENEKKDKYSTK